MKVRTYDEIDPVDAFRLSVVAQVVPLRFPVRLASGVEEVGGVAGVCSHPSVWGRGFAHRLMDAAHTRLRELGLRISTLTTSRNIRGYRVYAKMGYADFASSFADARSSGTSARDRTRA